jgi:hypothetical protein
MGKTISLAKRRRTATVKAIVVGLVVASSSILVGPGQSVAKEYPAATGQCARVGAVRTIGGAAHVCVLVGKKRIWVPKTSSRTTTTTTLSTTTTTTRSTTTTTVAPSVTGLPRSAVDRPGANTADIKFIYVTFRDGPDSGRDSNGDIAGMASEVNRYYQSQFPGKRLRYDTFQGGLDVQHIQLPLSNAEFNRRWCFGSSDSPAGCDRPDVLMVLDNAFRDAGLPWEIAYNTGRWNANDRGYVLLFEGNRGLKAHNGGWQKKICSDGDNENLGIVMRFLRDEQGNECPLLGRAWSTEQAPFKWWGFTVTRGITSLLTLMPGCAHVTRASDGPIGLNELQPENEMASQGALYNFPIGSSRIAQLDPARNRYFKINNGPYVGDRCRDVQYSPLWENVSG